MPQQTPVQWLIRNVNENIPPKYIPKEVVEIAKQLEKNFAAEMFLAGKNSETDNKKTFEQYYNETYNK